MEMEFIILEHFFKTRSHHKTVSYDSIDISGVAILASDNHTPGQRKYQEQRMVMINDKGVCSQKPRKNA